MQSRTLKTSTLTTSFLDLYIFNYNGDQTAFGFNSLPATNLMLRQKIAKFVPTAATVFASDFINYTEGKILCVNTQTLMNKDVFKTFNSVSNTLKFTLVLMPEEFINSKPNQLSSPYVYGERIRVIGSFEPVKETTTVAGKTQTTLSRNKTYFYRDSNIKARSKGGQSQSGTGVGVWS
jgi:hypothetical protein